MGTLEYARTPPPENCGYHDIPLTSAEDIAVVGEAGNLRPGVILTDLRLQLTSVGQGRLHFKRG
jgi:hypothetical protein